MGRIFAIGDPHLSRARPKPMDIFGEHWKDHSARIFDACRRLLTDEDLIIFAGDISWATRLEEARPDLDEIGALPGRKLLLKGNHDYWWQSRSKVEGVVHPSVSLLHCDAHLFEGTAIVGGRGWTLPGTDESSEEDEKIYRRELERLRLSLAALRGLEYTRVLAAMHYPPLTARGERTEVTDLLERYGVRVCVYGHLHGDGIAAGFTGERNGIYFKLLSADSVDFTPVEVFPAMFPGSPESGVRSPE